MCCRPDLRKQEPLGWSNMPTRSQTCGYCEPTDNGLPCGIDSPTFNHTRWRRELDADSLCIAIVDHPSPPLPRGAQPFSREMKGSNHIPCLDRLPSADEGSGSSISSGGWTSACVT